jgi:hypothetical protein
MRIPRSRLVVHLHCGKKWTPSAHEPPSSFLLLLVVVGIMVPVNASNFLVGSAGVFGKNTKEYSDLVVMFAVGTIHPTMKPSTFYNNPRFKSTCNKFSFKSFSGNWYNGKKEAGFGTEKGQQ